MAEAKYVILGNGVAGITAAQEIRHLDKPGHILIVSDEGMPYYYRASLSEWLSGDLDDESLVGRTPAFYEQMALETVEGHVTHVNPEARVIYLEDGAELAYDKLLLATGARANVLPVEGLDEVLVFRDFADVKQIQARLGCCGRALILGGGILGLELAGALHKLGLAHIAVVQRSDFVGKPLLDAPAAEWLQARMRADEIELFLGDTVARVEGQTAYFKSGRMWEFDIFVQAVGITPVFPTVPGLNTGRGVQIDNRARTNLPDIYAAGDCTEVYNAARDRWETTRVWLDCARQGKVAGRAMAGQSVSLPTDLPFYNASLIYTVLYTYVGEPHGVAGDVYVWSEGEAYRKARVVDGRLAGALLLGNRYGGQAMLHLIGQPVGRLAQAHNLDIHDIACPEFPYNDLTGRDWDYLFY